MRWRACFHVLVFVSLLGVYAHEAAETGPTDNVDARWYIGYALSIFHESRLPQGRVEIVPLHPLWLAMWMHVDPGIHDYLQCLHGNLPYWSEGKKYYPERRLDVCRPLDNAGFYVLVLLGAVGIGLVWLAGWLVSGRLMVAHLSGFFALYAQGWIPYSNSNIPESLAIPLFAGVNVCLAWLVCACIGEGSGRTKLRTAAVAVTCGLLLGALALTRPPYEFLLAALPFAAAAWMLSDRPRRREITAATAWILVGASLATAPWLVRNYTEKGFVGFTQGYGPGILVERLVFNDMTWRQWAAAFPLWSGRGGHGLGTKLFEPETVAFLQYSNSHPGSYVHRARSDLNDMSANVAVEDQLGFALGQVWADLPKHLAVSVPLAWRGMKQWRESRVPYGSVLWLLVIFSFARGTHRNRSVLAALAFCPFVVLAINALVSTSLPRYSFGLLAPLSVGVALPVAWVVEGGWNRMRGWIPWPGSRGPDTT